MRLTVKQLQEITKQTLLTNKLTSALKVEVRKTFGTVIITEHRSIENIARQVNDLLEMYNQTGQTNNKTLQTTLLLKLAQEKTPEARKLAARLLPEKLSLKLAFDKVSGVRSQVAKRAPIGVLIEMCKKFPNDDALSLIKTERLLAEFDAKNLQKLEKQELDLSDGWYHQQARKLIDDYGELNYGVPRNVERTWKNIAVKRLCDSYKSSYNVDIDCEKLLKTVDELLEELDQIRIPMSMRDIKEQLIKNVKKDIIAETKIMPLISETIDPITSLLKIEQTSKFINEFETFFAVKKSNIVGQLKTLMLQEGIVETITVPVKAKLPYFINESIEKVLNLYVARWNKLNENVVFDLNWNIDPNNDDAILFGARLK